MVVRRTKKVRRQRGGRSHGWGVVKDHKGHGMSGGRGGAGVSQHKWIQTIIRAKEAGVKPLGKYGFKRPQEFQKKYEVINVSHLNESVETLVENGKAEKSGDAFTVNLKQLGVTKLLAQGTVTKKLNVTVERATERAVKKVEAAGGSVTLLSVEN